MHALKTVIFDMDGVLIDSEPVYYSLQKQMFAELGIAVTAEEDRMFVGWPDINMWAYLKGKYPTQVGRTPEELSAWSHARFKGYLSDAGRQHRPIAGVVELLVDLKQHGVDMVIASSSARDTIKQVCDVLMIREYFSLLVSGTEVPHGKPAPDVFLRAAVLARASAAECVVIEDSHNGVTAAKAAHMACIGVKQPSAPAEQDLSAADLVVSSLELIDHARIAALLR